MKPNPEPLKKALRALKKCHDEVAGGQRDLPVMLAQLESEREKTDPSDLIRGSESWRTANPLRLDAQVYRPVDGENQKAQRRSAR